MRPRVAIVTDSTASIPSGTAYQLGVEIVQLQLRIDGVEDDEARIPSSKLADAMRANIPVATAPPDPGAFFWTYQGLASRGAQAIISVHLSGKLSKTCEAARLAASQVGVPVHVIDSETISMSLGFAAMAGARTAQMGADPAQVASTVLQRLRGSSEVVYVDTLEYLRRGGRIGAAAKFLGDALSIKPLLTVKAGELEPLHKVRGTQRALKRLVESAVQRSGKEPVSIAIEHFAADEEAERAAYLLRKKLPHAEEFLITEVSAIIGAHVGPGALAITVSKT